MNTNKIDVLAEAEPSAYVVKRDGDGHVVVQDGVGTVCYCFADDGGLEARRIATLLSGAVPPAAPDLSELVNLIRTARSCGNVMFWR